MFHQLSCIVRAHSPRQHSRRQAARQDFTIPLQIGLYVGMSACYHVSMTEGKGGREGMLNPKALPPGYRMAARREGEPHHYVRPDGTQSQGYTRRILAVNAAWQEYGQRKAAEESGQASK